MGLAATLEALSTSTAGTAVARFFSGTSQGTFSSTVPLYYTYWYTREELALRITMYVGITASLGAFSTWVAYLVTLIKSHLPPNKVSLLILNRLTVDLITTLRSLSFLVD